MALAVWQLSPANTDDDSQYITALQISIVFRVDSKTPPGRLGRQPQYSAAAKVTGLLPYVCLAVQGKAVLQIHTIPLAKAGQTTGLFPGPQQEQEQKARECKV
jgi:hypothetical protein